MTLGECFPYLAKRLLSDDSPRARGALRTLLYGGGDEVGEASLAMMVWHLRRGSLKFKQ
jgi:hypothetical protein